MKNSFAGFCSKKLMLAGAVLGLIVHDAEVRPFGWIWWHAISVAIITGCYCLAAAYQDRK